MTTDNTGNNDAGSQGQPEGSAAADESLDSILNKFDSKASGANEGTGDTPLTNEERTELNALKEERLGRRVDTALDDIMSALKGDSNVDDAMVRGWLEIESGKNPDLTKLIAMRFENRAQFDKAVAALVPDFNKYVEASGMTINQGDDNAMSAAIRQSRSTTKSSKDFGNEDLSELNDADFAMKSREILRAAEAGELA